MTLAAADRLDLSDLVHRYAAYVDARRFDEVAELFTVAAELMVPEPPDRLGPSVSHRGRGGVRSAMAPLDRLIRTHHSIAGEVYTAAPSDNMATGLITGVAHHWADAGGEITDTVWYLHYTDEYCRTDAGWRIAVRELSIDAISALPTHCVQRQA